MKNIKRVLAAISALAISIVTVSCGGNEEGAAGSTAPAESAAAETTTVTTKEAQSVEMNEEQKSTIESLADSLPDMELSNTTVKFISHWDMNPGDGQVVPPYLQLFRDKYDGKIEWVQTTWENRYDDIKSLILAKDSPDFFPAMDSDGFPMGALKGYFQPIDNYVDLKSSLWSNAGTQATIDKFKFEGNHYVAATGASPNIVCIYNRKTIRDNGLEDPAELFKNDEWTWSKYKELCEKFTDPSAEKVGLDGYWYDQGLNSTTGVPIIGLDEKGKAVSNIESPEVRKAQDFLYSLEQAKVYFDRSAHNNLARGAGSSGSGEGMSDGLTLFYPCGLWAIENTPESTVLFGNVEAGDIMFVPMPRPDDCDKYYVDSRLDNGYLLVKNAPNPQGFAALMNCIQLAAHSSAATDVSNDQLKNSYKWNDEMIEMKQTINGLCEQNAVFDFGGGVSAEVSEIANEIKGASINGSYTKDWDTVIAEYNDRLNFELDKANSQIPEF